MTDEPAVDDLERGHVVLAPNPFVVAQETTPPWVVVNNKRMPVDSLQYIIIGMTIRTRNEERVALSPDDYRHRRAPVASSNVSPFTVTTGDEFRGLLTEATKPSPMNSS